MGHENANHNPHYGHYEPSPASDWRLILDVPYDNAERSTNGAHDYLSEILKGSGIPHLPILIQADSLLRCLF
jgi:hypothetical protein